LYGLEGYLSDEKGAILAYNEELAQRIRQILRKQSLPVEEKKMMGGLTFMVDEKMCVGIIKDDLMARISPDEYESVLQKKGCRPMDFTGRPMIGYVFVDQDVISSDQQLNSWVQLALDFNPYAKKSKSSKNNRTNTQRSK
jgi:TfoX/Sxy family transcriptional regulator of competence genes